MGQDTLLHALEGRPGLDAEVVRQPRPGLAVDVQRVGLPAGAVQRQHELLPEGLAVGLLEREGPQLLDELPVKAERQVRVEPVLERGQPQLVETRGFAARERLVGELHERRAAPQGERLSEVSIRGGGVAIGELAAAISCERLEARSIEGAPARPAGGSRRCRSRDARRSSPSAVRSREMWTCSL